MKNRLWICTAVLAALPATAWASPELRCIEQADKTLLDQLEVASLCRGASSAAPVDCYREATNDTPLPDSDAIELCRCADSTEPVACFREAREQRPDDLREAIRLCSPITVRNLTADCRPLVPVAPRSGD